MEKNANYALVGFAAMFLFVGLIVFVIWLARFSVTREYDLYDIIFEGPVRGISEGGEVHFNGIKVGDVTRISLDPQNAARVIARVKVTDDVPIKTDSYATLEAQGITGVNYVQITAGTPGRPLLKDVTPRGDVPVLRSQKGALADLLEGGGTVLQRTVEALDRVNRLLSDSNIRAISGTMEDVNAISGEVRARKALIADAQRSLQSIDLAAQRIGVLAESSNTLVNTDAKRALSDLADAATEIKAAANDTRGMISDLKGPTSDFATNGLPQLTEAIGSLQTATDSLNRVVTEAEQSPRAFIGKTPAKEVKVKP
jgi:phospholipid/cholesterol/gamma-HCH transport system substrate-binding protein